MSRSWTDLLRSLGESLLGLVDAEVAALKGDLKASGRQLSIAVALLVLAAFLFFWVVGVAGFVCYQILTLWLPSWGSAAIVWGIYLCLAILSAALARRRLRAIEPPVETFRRHADDHRDWWRSQVLMEPAQERDSLTGDAVHEQRDMRDT